MPEAEAYLDKVCACIRDKHTRERVREEMRDHIDALAADYMADGMSEDEAYRKAADSMGSANAVGEELGRIHSFFPRRRFCAALTLLFWGFLISSFTFDFNGWYVDEIAQTLGSFLMLASMFMLRRSDSLLTAALTFLLISSVLGIINSLIAVLPPFPAEAGLSMAILIVGNLLHLAFMCAMGYGIARFTEGKRARQMRQCGYLYAGEYLCLLMAFLLPDVFVLWYIILALLIIVILHHIRCVRTDIRRNDREVPVRKMGALTSLALVLVIVMTVAVPTAASAALTARPAAFAAYSAVDAGADAATTARVEAVKDRIKEESGYDLIEGKGHTQEEFLDAFDSALRDICQSDLLAWENALSFSTFGWSTASGMEVLLLTAVLTDSRAEYLCYYRLRDWPDQGAQQVTYVFDGQYIDQIPNSCTFVTLCDLGDKTVEVLPAYEMRRTGRGTDGVEFNRNKSMTAQRGYIRLAAYHGEKFTSVFTVRIYEQTSFFRSPYDYDNFYNEGYDKSQWYCRETSVVVHTDTTSENDAA